MQLLERKSMLRRMVTLASWALAPPQNQGVVHAFSNPLPNRVTPNSPMQELNDVSPVEVTTAAYKGITLPVDEFGVKVPVACWFPKKSVSADDTQNVIVKQPSYDYRISVRRIGQLLAGWDFIPGLVARDFSLAPARSVVDGTDDHFPESGPVILLAHGYLGSRFDLSNLAESLAAEGFTCLAAEYPESLAASYDRIEGLDRAVINDALLGCLESKLNIRSKKFGIIGHSLGCGTALRTGDGTWARVCIAGFPRQRDGSVVPGNVLFISSMNDGAVSPARFGGAQGYPKDISLLDQDSVLDSTLRLPSRAAILYDKPDAPNHISFLSESVNDAMIDFLSGLLPVAKAFSIPLLDFDRYQTSRDSKKTAEMVHPLVVKYMKQEMM